MTVHEEKPLRVYSQAIRLKNLEARRAAWDAIRDDCEARRASDDIIVKLNAGGYCVVHSTIWYLVTCVENGVSPERILSILDDGYSAKRRLEGLKLLIKELAKAGVEVSA